MKTIYVFCHNQPCLQVNERGMGMNRDRLPDNGWDQLRNTDMSYARPVDLTEELKIILLEDLAYAFGGDSKKFTEKIKEFELI